MTSCSRAALAQRSWGRGLVEARLGLSASLFEMLSTLIQRLYAEAFSALPRFPPSAMATPIPDIYVEASASIDRLSHGDSHFRRLLQSTEHLTPPRAMRCNMLRYICSRRRAFSRFFDDSLMPRYVDISAGLGVQSPDDISLAFERAYTVLPVSC